MRIICVDPDAEGLRRTAAVCGSLPEGPEVLAFEDPAEALAALKAAPADLLLPESGPACMDLARRANARPGVKVVFVTDDPSRAAEAYAMHAAGYVLKPLTAERLAEEIRHAFGDGATAGRQPVRVTVRTFGNFDVQVDGRTLVFARSKAKELLAYLVDRQGRSVTRSEVFAKLWEEGLYDRPHQKQLDVVIRSLRASLRDAGVPEILEMRGGTLRVRPERLDCDLYAFLEGKASAVSTYRGEYMSAYSWASLTEGYMDRLNRRDGL